MNLPIYISLGGNCSVTYQLKLRNLRYKAYPFDWTKISINQLINILENNFKDFIDSIRIKKNSIIHINFNTEENNSLILTNNFNILFAHEISDINNSSLDIFKQKLYRRIDRIYNLINHSQKIIFIRIELQPIKIDYINKIKILLNLLNTFSNNFILKLILNIDKNFDIKLLENLSNNLLIYKFNIFSEDWKMNHIDWDNIINN